MIAAISSSVFVTICADSLQICLFTLLPSAAIELQVFQLLALRLLALALLLSMVIHLQKRYSTKHALTKPISDKISDIALIRLCSHLAVGMSMFLSSLLKGMGYKHE